MNSFSKNSISFHTFENTFFSMISSGRNTHHQLIVQSNDQSKDGSLLVNPPLPIDINYDIISDLSIGNQHTVFITKDGKAFAVGDDREFFIGTQKREIYNIPTEVQFSNINDRFISAKCGQIYTIYLTEKGFIIYCSQKSINKIPSIHTFECKPIFISSGYLSPVAIDAQGDFYIFSKNPASAPRHVHLREPVYDICRCSLFVKNSNPAINGKSNNSINVTSKISFTAAVTVNGKLFANGYLNNDSRDFSEVYSMHGIHIHRVYGYCGHCIAVSDDGRVFDVGDNQYNQLGNGQTSDAVEFEQLTINESIIDAAVGGAHSLLVTESGKLFGFGNNKRYQLFSDSFDCINRPIDLHINGKVTFAWCGNTSSIALINQKAPKHLGYSHFFAGKELLESRLRKISVKNIQNMEEQIQKLKNEIEIEKKRTAPDRAIIDENKKLKGRMEMKLSDIFNENDRLSYENEQKDQEINNLKNIIDQLSKENENLKNQNKEHQVESNEIKELRRELDEKTVHIANLLNIIEQTKERLNTAHLVQPTNNNYDSSVPAISPIGRPKGGRPNITRPMITNRK
ncbi:hypothetical protein TRFO_17607 [Tritrichomonas foetus]|uniref:Uncharacterized protein n=1 Tax=Tritrichomonas foetus TaxID=1144522 RepID=A0A1J4KRM5_9EUKA|nr:hypothetical protein TRFO_17607 [Tritrichomonas foetus]|eukprot:OHT12468.1 hypothetical protein TRFO_17607 [Tritrichomonas foetus]